MPVTEISFRDTNYFSSLICDYLDNVDELKPFYTYDVEIESFKEIIKIKEESFSKESRKVLVQVLNGGR